MSSPENGSNKPQIITRHEYHKHQGPRWPIFAAFLVAALLTAVILVFGGRWLYRSFVSRPSHTVKTVPADVKKLPKAPPASGTLNPAASPPPQVLPTTGG